MKLAITDGNVVRQPMDLYVGKQRTGIAIVPDDKWLGMWRVRGKDGQLSEMVNIDRAKNAALIAARIGGGGVDFHWDRRQPRRVAAPVRFEEGAASPIATHPK